MNRTAALLLALTTLLAHALLVHQDSAGRFAPPYDAAHVAFRLARNLVYTGEATWNPGMLALESHPSPLWVFLCGIGERLYLPVTTFAQTLGILCTLATVVLAAQFTRERLAGVVAPLLLVVSGSVAATGPGGTETGLLLLLVTAAFLAQEKRRPRLFAVLAALLWITRWDGAFAVLVLFGFELSRTLRRRSTPGLLPAFVAPLLAGLLLAGLRWVSTGAVLSPSAAYLLGGHGGALELGLPYLRQFVLATGTPLLVVFPLAYFLRRRLVGRARRALVFTLAWSALVAWTGGDRLPFWSAMVPTVSLLFLAIQDALMLAVDGRRPWVARACVAALSVAIVTSVLASKLPGKVGPFPAPPLPRHWVEPSDELSEAYARAPGRPGLMREINQTERLRSVGVFLRDNLGARATILTPWPGAIAYLSRRVVYDLGGRATLAPGHDRLLPWFGAQRVDLVALLDRRPDYIVAWIAPGGPAPEQETIARSLLTRFDLVGGTPERASEFLARLETYEPVAVPVPAHSSDPEAPSEYPAYLLRRRDLELTPRLQLARSGASIEVSVRHRGHFQLADLEVRVEAPGGHRLYLRPTGELEPDPDLRARKRLLLYGTGARRVRLLSAELPEELAQGTVVAVLRNPGSEDPASEEVRAEP